MNFEFDYREAVATQSPGLLQPWEIKRTKMQPGTGCILAELSVAIDNKDVRNPITDATALRLIWFGALPRVEATLGSASQPLRGILVTYCSKH